MAKDDLIDSHVSTSQCKRAVDALLSFETKREEERTSNELLPGKEPNVWLVVTTKRMQPTYKMKPIKIPVAHPLVDPRTSSICLITKDPQREYKDLLEAKGIKFISRVVGLEKLKGKFKPFEARRMLLKENGLFLADERIVTMLPKLLGSKFFQAKKQPIPVCLTRKDLKGELERAVSSTYMHQNQGTCTSIKVGTLSQKPAHILENIVTALPAIVQGIKDGWDNIQSLSIKTNSSASLPIWACTLDGEDGGRWAGLTVRDVDAEDTPEGSVVGSDDEVPAKGKGKRRAADEAEAAAKPSKKAKGADVTTPSKSKPAPGPTPKSKAKDAASPSKKSADEASATPAKKNAKSKAAPSPAKPAASDKEAAVTPKKKTQSAKTADTSAPKSATSTPAKSAKAAAKDENKPAQKPAKDAVSSLTQKELKQKRVGGADKKKEKSIGLKESKSAKSALLGKKVAKA
ncbi:hypothetical protein HGRIS_003697 [Hohenbuehelia grisea]|uniref:Ribosomal protein L1 n=1 Tax=Hohenbuehelia grisea TaxID=104357 RepID=A0ABR3JHY3_9AGAR